MNANTFRLIFSKHLGMCVPVAEQSCAQGKRASRKVAQLVLKPLAVAWLTSLPAFALPVAPVVVNGSASFSQSGNTLTVTNTPNAILNWGSFSIGQNELTRFVQQGSTSAVLNRVTSQNPSQILGQLQSNGRVFLINPNGIVFGQGARIDTAGLVASTLSLSDADFLAGKLRLTGTGSEGQVDNQGTIATANGGFVYLIAPNVENSGVIHAPNGDVLLAAGQSVEIADGLNPALRVVLTAPEGSVVNLGQILAESGRVGLHGGLVSNAGTISASSAVAEGGKIYLKASQKIELTDTSKVSADGATGGVVNAIVQKDGKTSGELVARGEISAQGNGAPGSGGFVETSAAKLDLNTVTVETDQGQWLLDPNDFVIAASGGAITGSALSSALASNSVTIQTTSGNASCTGASCDVGTPGNGDIFVNDAVSWGSAQTLTLSAYRDININQSITASHASGKLALEYGQGAVAGGNTATYKVSAPINLQAGNNFSTKLGSDGGVRNFTVVTLLGNASSSNDGTLQGLQSNLSGSFVLGADIDASATSTWNADGAGGYYGFSRIGDGQTFDNSSRFTGIFDGLGHTISNLYLRRPNSTLPTFNANDYVGLFGANQGTIRNVGLLNANVSGRMSVGALVGVNGVNAGAVVSNSYSTGTVSGADSVGGLIGQINGGSVSYSYSSASVSSGGAAGGLVGVVNANAGGSINNSYALGTVSGAPAGGLVGALNNVGTVTNSYSASPGIGLIGSGAGLVTNSYWDNVIGASSSAGTGAIGRTTTQMKDAANFTRWDFTNVWNIDSGTTISYPYLRTNEQVPHPGLSRGATTCSVCTWDGGGGSNASWSLASNWTSDLLPAAASTVTIGGGYSTVLFDINNLSLASLTASSALDIQSGKMLTLTGNATFNAQVGGSGTLDIAGATVNANANAINIAKLNLSAGSLSGTGNLTVSNHFNWSGGTLGSTFQNLSLTKQGDFSIGSISALGNITLYAQDGNLSLTGNLSKTGGSAATLTLNADGTIVINSGATVDAGTGALAASVGIGTFSNAGTVNVGSGSSISAALNNTGAFNVTNGTLSLLAGASNSGTFNLTGTGSIRLPNSGNGYPTFSNAAGGVLNINSNSGGWSFVSDSGTQGGIVNNAGTININTSYTSWEAAFTNSSAGLLNLAAGNALSMQNGQTLQGNIALGAGATLWVSERHGTNAWFNGTTISGTGTVQVAAGVGPVADFTNVNAAAATLQVDNGGTVNLLAGSTTFANLKMKGGALSGDGTLNLNTALTQTGGTQSGSGRTVLGASATSTLGAASLNRALTNQGTLNLNQTTVSGSLENSGTLNVVGGTSTAAGAFTQSGILDIASGASFVRSGGFSNTGTIRGKGTIGVGATGTLDNNGTIRPGASPGTLTINGNYSQGPNGTLVMELGGTTQGVSYDWLNVTGTASLGGTLQVDLYGGFVPVAGNSFDLVSATGGVSGTFSQNNLPVGYSFASSYGGNLFNLNLQPTAAPASAGTANAVLDALLNMTAVSYETPLLYLSGQSSSTASSSGLLIQTAETVLPDLLPDAPFSSTELASPGAPVNSLLPLFDELARDAIFKDIFHDSRLICR